MYTSLCLFANKYLEDIELSKDVVQEIFIKIWEKQILFIDEKSVKSYLYTSIKNRALDILKSSIYKNTHNNKVEISEAESDKYFMKELMITETSRIINSAINTLPQECAKVVQLGLQEYSNLQIAEKLKISINTVKTQKKIANKKLRKLLKNLYYLNNLIFLFINTPLN